MGKIVQNITDFFAANPSMSGLFIVAIGVLIFIGALLKWGWVLEPSSRFSLLSAIFGARGQAFILSTIMIIGGIILFIVL